MLEELLSTSLQSCSMMEACSPRCRLRMKALSRARVSCRLPPHAACHTPIPAITRRTLFAPSLASALSAVTRRGKWYGRLGEREGMCTDLICLHGTLVLRAERHHGVGLGLICAQQGLQAVARHELTEGNAACVQPQDGAHVRACGHVPMRTSEAH